MIKYKVANKYAKALFELTKELNKTEKVLADLDIVNVAYQESKDFRVVFVGAVISKEEKKELIDIIFDKYKLEDITKNFLKILIDRQKFKFFPYIYEKFKKLYRDDIGIMEAEVITAVKLDKALLKDIISKLSQKTGKKLEVTEEVNPEIIGGIIIRTEGMTFDASLKMQLMKIKENILKG